MNITIVGGGNIGTQFAVHCAEKKHKVTVYTSEPALFSKSLRIVDENSVITHEGDIERATADPKEAFSDAQLILITYPATMMRELAGIICENANEKVMIGVVPGNGGSECAFRKCIERGNLFFGIERVPAIARLVEKGKTVKSTGYRSELHVAALPGKSAEECARIIENLFDIRTLIIPNYLNLTMTPSNPILHTVRLRRLFNDWHPGIVYDRVPLFYEDWDMETSEALIACDEEVQAICRALPEFDLTHVRSLKEHYESPTAEAMTRKISSILAFKGLTSPTIKTENGYIPDLHSRYFTADFSYGLSIIRQIAGFAEVPTPHIDDLMNWYLQIAQERNAFSYADYGIMDKKAFIAYYSL